ncbi:hypothetical protein MVEN_00186800 [Mycena venus]|uniref:DUF6533 domain-containing protein n=1 Tax=Mycena venus TaxID=2733690 RepID=A0A8H6YWZ5_9AGAR|nr:hypothetical protein MVEN_00186800 [Mycena venus]
MNASPVDDVTIAYGQRIDQYFYLAGFVVLCYDHTLVFEAEIRYIWARGHTKASAWYLFVRYVALCANLAMFVVPFSKFSTKEVMVETTLILRVLAMYLFDKRMMFILAIVEILAISLTTWSVLGSEPPQVYRDFSGCYSAIAKARRIRMAGTWEGILGTDMLFLALTLYRGHGRYRDGIGLLWHVLVRDGVMYYVIICLANGANILMYYFVGPNLSGGLSSFTVALSVTMACRLMLNLHEAASWTGDSSDLTAGSIQFARGLSLHYESRDSGGTIYS